MGNFAFLVESKCVVYEREREKMKWCVGDRLKT